MPPLTGTQPFGGEPGEACARQAHHAVPGIFRELAHLTIFALVQRHAQPGVAVVSTNAIYACRHRLAPTDRDLATQTL